MASGIAVPADEEAEIRGRFWHPQRGDVVIDVGSYEGTYTLPALAAGATVIAIDARRQTLCSLRERAMLGGLDGGLTVFHAAVFDGGTYPEELLEQIRTSMYASSREMGPGRNALWMTLDRIIGELELDRVDWLKVDVEGGELGVIRGAAKTLSMRPRVLIEDHSRVYPWVAQQQSTSRIAGRLKAAGYRVEFWDDRYVDYLVGHPCES